MTISSHFLSDTSSLEPLFPNPGKKDISLTVNGRQITCLPNNGNNLRENAINFLLNTGLITSLDQIADIRICGNSQNVDVWLTCSLPSKLDLITPQ